MNYFLRKQLVVSFGICCVLLATSPAFAAPIIDPGEILLWPNRAGQRVPLFVSGGDLIEGLNLHLTVEGGGPEISAEGKPGPKITDVDVLTGTIFSGNNDGQTNAASFPQAWAVSTATSNGTVRAQGRLAVLTFDTTGFPLDSGPFSLSLSDPIGTPTDFAGIPAELSEGVITISVIPEPASLTTLFVGMLFLYTVRRKRRDRLVRR